jgi:hypothetical protein
LQLQRLRQEHQGIQGLAQRMMARAQGCVVQRAVDRDAALG